MKNSKKLLTRAQELIPGGVNSPVRAFRGVGGDPIFFKKGEGCYLIDVDDKRYIDYIGSWGPLILGHCHPGVVAAVQDALNNGMSFGAPTELEIKLAEKVIEIMPNLQKVRMVNSGTEATMTALRLARGFTKKSKIIKFIGCYHGHSDALLVKAGSGLLTLGMPGSLGVLPGAVEHTLTADFNDLESVANIFAQYPDDIAAIIVEPVAGNMGLVLPEESFLEGLRGLCDEYNSILIFDEVMTGFRVALGGAQEIYGIVPDLTALGKIIGGGMPVGAIGGKEEIMDFLAPVGGVYQAGTLSGNPLAMAAGLATLNEVSKPEFHSNLTAKAEKLIKLLGSVCSSHSVPFCGSFIGGMFGFCFANIDKVRNMHDISNSDEEFFKKFYHGMLNQGVYFAPSLYEAGFISIAHDDKAIDETIQAADMVLSSLT